MRCRMVTWPRLGNAPWIFEIGWSEAASTRRASLRPKFTTTWSPYCFALPPFSMRKITADDTPAPRVRVQLSPRGQILRGSLLHATGPPQFDRERAPHLRLYPAQSFRGLAKEPSQGVDSVART